MKNVLLIDAYGPRKASRFSYHAFRRIISMHLDECIDEETHEIIERKVNDLSDIVCPFDEETYLTERSRSNCKAFDDLDLICIGGDMSICPWDAQYDHCIMLLHMALTCQKAIFAAAAGVFAVVYTKATVGRRLDLVNGPSGDLLDRLHSYPHYYAEETTTHR